MINKETYLKFCICNNKIKDIIKLAIEKAVEIRPNYFRIEPFSYIFSNETKIGKDILPSAINSFIIDFIVPDYNGNKTDLEDEIHLQITAIILRNLVKSNYIFKIYEAGYPDEDSYSIERPEYNDTYSTDFGNAYIEFIKRCIKERENDKIGINTSFDTELKFSYSEFKGYASIIKLEPIKTID